MVSNVPPKSVTSGQIVFIVGDHVVWRHIDGHVYFVDDDYITICVKGSQCCVLCYRENWKEVVHQGRK